MFDFLKAAMNVIRLLPTLATKAAGGATITTEPPATTDLMTKDGPVADGQVRAAVSTHLPEAPDVAGRLPTLRIDTTTFRLAAGQYMRETTEKSLVVLHFTAGPTARSAYQTWVADPRRVATAYIVGLDGAVYETFDPTYWAYALGVKGPQGPGNERRAVQVEICGYGPLKLRGAKLCAWPKDFTAVYCDVSETAKYVKKTFRGIDYFTAYPEAQVASVCALVREICERFEIPRDVPPAELRGVVDVARFSRWRGTCAHENFRTDKWDVGPAFPWDRLERELEA